MDSEGSTRGRRVCTLSYGVSFFAAPRARGRTDERTGRANSTKGASERRAHQSDATERGGARFSSTDVERDARETRETSETRVDRVKKEIAGNRNPPRWDVVIRRTTPSCRGDSRRDRR